MAKRKGKKNILVITDLEGALISSKAPEVDGRKYLSVMKNDWDKKVMASDNIQRLKTLDSLADIVPMTKQGAKQCNAMALCVSTPFALVEAGALLISGTQIDKDWRYETLKQTFYDDDLLRKGVKYLTDKGYEKNGANEFTLDCVNLNSTDIDADVETLKEMIGEKYKVLKVKNNRIYAYHRQFSRRAMVKKFIELYDYDTVIAIAANDTGWLPEGYETISVEGNGAKHEFPRDEYLKDIHAFATFALDKAIEIASGK